MRQVFIACWLLCGHPCPADELSGPERTTIQSFAWGSLYYDQRPDAPSRLESTSDGFQLSGGQGDVAIEATDLHTYRLTWRDESLTISQDGQDLDIRGGDQAWSLRAEGGQWFLSSSNPPDRLVFGRSGGFVTIKGAKGHVTVSGPPEHLFIRSPKGTTRLVAVGGRLTLAGVAMDQIPYLGRGCFIPFHGAGVFIDMAKLFPMPEVAPWIQWRPIL